MKLTPIQRARILSVIQGLNSILDDDDRPRTYALQTDTPTAPTVDVSDDWAEIEAALERLKLTWKSPRIVAYLEAVAKRTGKPADKQYLSAEAIKTLRNKLEEAIA